MTIHLYCICRNEARIMPYFLRHYVPWVDKLVFFDGQSTDGTRELIQQCPKAELRDFEGSDALVDDEFLLYSNSKWKESRGVADWVIWVDADEFIYHPHIRALLEGYKREGITVGITAGFTMVSDVFPTGDGQIYDEVKTGFSDWEWSKPAIFNPAIEMNFNVGRHSVNIDLFKPVFSPREIKLLHYRALGREYLKERHTRNWARVPQRCRERNYGVNCEPGHTGHHGLQWFDQMFEKSWVVVI